MIVIGYPWIAPLSSTDSRDSATGAEGHMFVNGRRLRVHAFLDPECRLDDGRCGAAVNGRRAQRHGLERIGISSYLNARDGPNPDLEFRVAPRHARIRRAEDSAGVVGADAAASARTGRHAV